MQSRCRCRGALMQRCKVQESYRGAVVVVQRCRDGGVEVFSAVMVQRH